MSNSLDIRQNALDVNQKASENVEGQEKVAEEIKSRRLFFT